MIIDLRSDTVTRPSAQMRAAMVEAPVGDDVYGEDPTVNLLQDEVAQKLGKQAALFVPSGTQSNLVALLVHCGRGDEYLTGDNHHTFIAEGGGAAALGGIHVQTLSPRNDGSLCEMDIAAAIKPEDVHFARTRLLCLENTLHGRPFSAAEMTRMAQPMHDTNLAVHLDGARLFNAAVALGELPELLCRNVDSVSVCLSKGLAAPMGSVLAGDATFIDEARHWRKKLGGGMRQAGVVAAAGLYALQHHIERLADDHRRSLHLADYLRSLLPAEAVEVHTNMVFLRREPQWLLMLQARLREEGILISARGRLVLHCDIGDVQLRKTKEIFARAIATLAKNSSMDQHS